MAASPGPTWLDLVLDRVSHALVQDPKWRRPLPPSFGPRAAEATETLSKRLQELPSALGPLDAAELCEFFQARRAAFGANPSGRARSFGLAKGAKLRRTKRSARKGAGNGVTDGPTEPWLLASRTRRVQLDVDRTTVPLLAWMAGKPYPARFTLTEALEQRGPLTTEEAITLLELLARHAILHLEAPKARARRGS